MDFLIEHIGQMILAVICSGMILVLFVTGEDAQMTQIGTMVIQRNDTCFKSRGDTNYSIAQEKENIRFFYEEKTYLAGEKVEILKEIEVDRRGDRDLGQVIKAGLNRLRDHHQKRRKM